MRKLAISIAAIFSALALAIFLWRIEPLLPERGGATCFAAASFCVGLINAASMLP